MPHVDNFYDAAVAGKKGTTIAKTCEASYAHSNASMIRFDPYESNGLAAVMCFMSAIFLA